MLNGIIFSYLQLRGSLSDYNKICNFLIVFVFAVFLSVIFLKTKNIIYSIVAHSFYNLFTILFNSSFLYFNDEFGNLSLNFNIAITVVSFVIFIVFSSYFFKNFIPEKL